MKGSKAREELLASEEALKILNSKLEAKEELILPYEKSIRINISIRKLKATPMKYPRNFGKIKKDPL